MWKLFLVTIRRDTEIIDRRFVRVDLTYIDEEDVIDMMEHEMRSEFAFEGVTFDILPLRRTIQNNSRNRS